MAILRITDHAIERFRERVQDAPISEITARLSASVIRKAADFGAPYVRLPTGQRIVLDGHVVVTVLPSDTWPQSLDRRRTNLVHRSRLP